MAKLPQNALFGWQDDLGNLGDLARLKLVMDSMPDESLMQKLEKERGKGRDDFPVRAMWNLVLAGYVFQHNTDASLLRELARNGQLRHICGFGFGKLPEPHNLSRFRSLLLKSQGELDAIFTQLNGQLYGLLEGFGKETAIDSKFIGSAAKTPSKKKALTAGARRMQRQA